MRFGDSRFQIVFENVIVCICKNFSKLHVTRGKTVPSSATRFKVLGAAPFLQMVVWWAISEYDPGYISDKRKWAGPKHDMSAGHFKRRPQTAFRFFSSIRTSRNCIALCRILLTSATAALKLLQFTIKEFIAHAMVTH